MRQAFGITYPGAWLGELHHGPWLLQLFIPEIPEPGVPVHKILKDGDGTGSGELHSVQPARIQAGR